jgi:hypothetical protein
MIARPTSGSASADRAFVSANTLCINPHISILGLSDEGVDDIFVSDKSKALEAQFHSFDGCELRRDRVDHQ